MGRFALALLAVLLPGFAQGFPDRPITIVTGYSPGGSTDIAARILADRMPAQLGPEARIVVENRPGAAGVVATEWLKRQPGDGYTLMVQEPGAGVAAPNALVGGTRYDSVNDFVQLGLISVPPGILIVTNRFPASSAPEVLETLRRSPPESLTYASSGVGGVLHLQSEMLAQILRTHFVHVSYRSGAQMLQAIHTGEAQFGIAALASAAAMLKDGMVRGVAMVGPRRFPVFPGIPTMAELGIQGFDLPGWFMLIAPAGVPAPVAEQLNRALVATLAEPLVRERLVQSGHAPPEGPNTLAGTREFMARELALYHDIVARTGVRLEP
jgi:tripartite-type tricarboxylate transporter receptor subunit TctC